MSPRIANVPIAILAGGRATRLGALSASRPKSLIEVGGRPFIDQQLRLLRERGLRRVVLCLGHLGEQVERHVGDGRQLGLEIACSYDGPRPLGTAGALRKAAPLLGELFFVLYGDSYLEVDYEAVLAAFRPGDACGLMTVLHNRGRWDRSNVLFRDGRLLAYDKRQPSAEMEHVDYGLSILRAEALGSVPGDAAMDLAELYSRLAADGRLVGHEVSRRFYEIGTPEGLEEARAHLKETTVSYAETYLAEAIQLIERLDHAAIERVVTLLVELRKRGGRLFVLGVGGSAANASHAVNDFRKLCGIEAYAPTDNVSELTARVNDDGWESVFVNWLRVSRLGAGDALFVFSVGGGDLARNVSPNLVRALELARQLGATILGVVGRDGGFTAQVADACVVVPTVSADRVTPHTEASQALVWHLVVSHPALRTGEMKWESQR